MAKVLGEHIKAGYAKLGFFGKILLSLKNLGLTPNKLTIFSFIIALLGVSLVIKGYLVVGWILLLIDRVLDAFDGALARKFRMESKLGEWLDKTKDIIVFALIYFAVGYINLIPMYLSSLLIIATTCSIISVLLARTMGLKKSPFPYFTVSTFFVLGMIFVELINWLAIGVLILEVIALIANYILIIVKNYKD